MNTEIVYLYHFDQKIAHAQHYLGSCVDLDERDYLHQTGQGARLLQVAKERGVKFEIVRTWQGGRQLERKLKNRHDGARLCPICRNERKRQRRQLSLDSHFLDVFTLADVPELSF